MSEHPSAAAVRNLAEAVERGDLEAVMGSFTDDSVYRVPGRNLVTGNYRGKQEIQDFFFRLAEMTGGTFRVQAEDVIGTDGHAVMFWHLTARRPDTDPVKEIDARGAMAFKLDGDLKIRESWFLYNDQQEYDDFWS